MKNSHFIILSAFLCLTTFIGCGDDSSTDSQPKFAIVDVIPRPGQQLVATDVVIAVTFNAPIDTASVCDTSLILVNGGAGTISCDNRTLTLTLPAALDTSTQYQVRVPAGLASTTSGELTDDFTWAFTTVDGRGSVWLESADLAGPIMMDVLWADNKFVMVGIDNITDEAAAIYTSADGIEWTERQPPEPSVMTGLIGICYFQNQFIAVGVRGTILRSDDGETWTKVDAEIPWDLYGVAASPDVVVASAWDDGEGVVYISSDGLEWSEVSVPYGDDQTGISWTGSQFIITTEGDSLAHFLVSTNGLQWQDVTFKEQNLLREDFYSTASSGNLIVAVGPWDNLYTSPDAIAWTRREIPVAPNEWIYLLDVIWIGDRFVSVGASHYASGGYTTISADGVTWTQDTYTAFNGGKFTAVAWSGERLVVSTSGMGGRIFYSP